MSVANSTYRILASRVRFYDPFPRGRCQCQPTPRPDVQAAFAAGREVAEHITFDVLDALQAEAASDRVDLARALVAGILAGNDDFNEPVALAAPAAKSA